MKENPNMSREDIIKGFQDDVRFTVPENLLNSSGGSNSNSNNLDNLIKKDKNTGVEYIPFG